MGVYPPAVVYAPCVLPVLGPAAFNNEELGEGRAVGKRTVQEISSKGEETICFTSCPWVWSRNSTADAPRGSSTLPLLPDVIHRPDRHDASAAGLFLWR